MLNIEKPQPITHHIRQLRSRFWERSFKNNKRVNVTVDAKIEKVGGGLVLPSIKFRTKTITSQVITTHHKTPRLNIVPCPQDTIQESRKPSGPVRVRIRITVRGVG